MESVGRIVEVSQGRVDGDSRFVDNGCSYLTVEMPGRTMATVGQTVRIGADNADDGVRATLDGIVSVLADALGYPPADPGPDRPWTGEYDLRGKAPIELAAEAARIVDGARETVSQALNDAANKLAELRRTQIITDGGPIDPVKVLRGLAGKAA